jgi:hypothetical protein
VSLDLHSTEFEIDRLDRVRRSAEAAAAAYVRALTEAAKGRARDDLSASRAELQRWQSELSRGLDRIGGLAFATPCEAAPLAFAFAAAGATLAALARLARARAGGRARRTMHADA